MENVDILTAFGGGILSFLSPCVLPMVPVYLAALAGADFLDPEKVHSLKRSRFFLHSLSFVLGFTVVFAGLGALAGLTGTFISPDSAAVRWGTGSLLLLLGAYMLAATRFPQLNFEKRLHISAGTGNYARSFLTGAIFTFAWTPCVSPILGSILTLSLASETVWQGSGLLLVYSLGLGIPFLAIGLAIGSALPLLRRITRFTIWFYIIGGIAMVGVGVLILTGNLNLLSI
ncbi:cytochrome c biogenesis protein CcdA [Dehalogenimonas sp. 4OHTPN]|uniref:Cytochrome c biogenesis protein CcdA n=1 Tax=Dehalogenimonas sp. 4OHTPN TaxID=3166643 RepID=A0AAU8GA85_9CHLR